jgi:hypothetical protein
MITEARIAKAESIAAQALADARAWFPEAAARVETRQKRPNTGVTKAAAAPRPTSAAELRRLYDAEARAFEPDGSIEHARAKFAQTARGEQLHREILAAAEAERRTVTKATATPNFGTQAAARIAELVEQRVAKSPTPISKAQAWDLIMRENPSLYSDHAAETRPPAPGPSAAWAEAERRAGSWVAKGMTRAKAIERVFLDDPGLYTVYKTGR